MVIAPDKSSLNDDNDASLKIIDEINELEINVFEKVEGIN